MLSEHLGCVSAPPEPRLRNDGQNMPWKKMWHPSFKNISLCLNQRVSLSSGVCLCLSADGSLPKEPRDVSSQMAGKTLEHTTTTTTATQDRYFRPLGVVVAHLSHLPSLPSSPSLHPPPHPSLTIGYMRVASLGTRVTPVSVATVCSRWRAAMGGICRSPSFFFFSAPLSSHYFWIIWYSSLDSYDLFNNVPWPDPEIACHVAQI